MLNRIFIVLICAASVLFAANGRVAAYFPYWLQYAQFSPQDIRYDFLTEVRYANLVPEEDASLLFADEGDISNFELLSQLSAQNKVELVVSIGGYGTEEVMHSIANSEELRSVFITNLQKFIAQYQVKVIEVDWLPGTNDAFTAFHTLLKAMVGAGIQTSAVLLSTESAVASYDIDILSKLSSVSVFFTNQVSVEESEIVIPNADLVKAKSVLSAYVNAGIAPEKIFPVVPFYGKSFYKASGLGSSFEGAGSGNEGVLTYVELMKVLDGSDYQVTFDENTWSEIAISKMETIVFNGIPSMKVFADYVKKSGFGGIAVYDISGDHSQPIVSLLVTIGKVLRPEVNYLSKKGKKK